MTVSLYLLAALAKESPVLSWVLRPEGGASSGEVRQGHAGQNQCQPEGQGLKTGAVQAEVPLWPFPELPPAVGAARRGCGALGAAFGAGSREEPGSILGRGWGRERSKNQQCFYWGDRAP